MIPPEMIDIGELRLRRPRASDVAAVFEYGSDPDVAHYADWPLRTTIEPFIALLQQRAARWDSGEDYYWVITMRDDDRAIGGISCRVSADAAEIGFLLHRRYWGLGIATRVARVIVEWAMSVPEVARVWATCDVENVASARVLEKAGLSREAMLQHGVVRPNISNEPRDAFLYSRGRGSA